VLRFHGGGWSLSLKRGHFSTVMSNRTKEIGLLPPLCVHEQRAAPMTPAGFRKLFSRLAVVAKILFPVHPHMLRHACGCKLANDGRDTRAFFGVTKVPMGLTTALLDTERSAQCGDALLGRYVASRVTTSRGRHVGGGAGERAGSPPRHRRGYCGKSCTPFDLGRAQNLAKLSIDPYRSPAPRSLIRQA